MPEFKLGELEIGTESTKERKIKFLKHKGWLGCGVEKGRHGNDCKKILSQISLAVCYETS